MKNLTVAHTILEQLGGSRFVAMTGAKHFLADERELRFMLPSRFAKDGINVVIITLDPSDLYTVRFLRMGRGGARVDTVKEVSGVYADMLVNLFERTTGLATVL